MERGVDHEVIAGRKEVCPSEVWPRDEQGERYTIPASHTTGAQHVDVLRVDAWNGQEFIWRDAHDVAEYIVYEPVQRRQLVGILRHER